jgi:hypothetical protein
VTIFYPILKIQKPSADNLHPANYRVKLGVFDEALGDESGEVVSKVN